MPQTLRRLVISRTDHIGDVVLSLPVFASVKKCFPEIKTMALVGSYTADVVRSCRWVDEVVACDPDESLISVYRKLKHAAPDAIVVLYRDSRLQPQVFWRGFLCESALHIAGIHFSSTTKYVSTESIH